MSKQVAYIGQPRKQLVQLGNADPLSILLTCLEFKHPAVGLPTRRWGCEQCEASFHTKSNLTRHRVAAHSLARLVQCETCGKEFKGQSHGHENLVYHRIELKIFPFCLFPK